MSRDDPEDLLRSLADVDEERTEPPPDDLLRAFRAGELGEPEALGVIRALATNPAARERLAELTGVRLPEPKAGDRRRMAARLADGEAVPRPSRPAVRWGWGLAAAAVLAGALGVSLWRASLPNAPVPVRPAPTNAVGIQGTQLRRSAGADTAQSPSANAHPDTAVAFPVALPDDDVHVGIYAVQGESLVRRLPPPGAVEDGNLPELSAPASRLVGEKPGTYDLYAVVAWLDDPLPGTVPLAGRTPEDALSDHGRRAVHKLQLKIS